VAERRLIRRGDLNYARATATAVIPVGGGTVIVSMTFTGLAGIEMPLFVRVSSAVPPTADIYQPVVHSISGNVVGFSLRGGTGTTLGLEAFVLGY